MIGVTGRVRGQVPARVRGQVPEPSYKMGLFYLTRPLLVGSFYLTRPLLLGEAPQPLLNPPLLRSGGLKAWPAGPVLANKLSPLRGCS